MRRLIFTIPIVFMLALPPLASAKPQHQCIVPKLTGQTLSAARAKIVKAHCKVGNLTEIKSPGTLRVTAQRPASGKREKAGTKVSITLKANAQGPIKTTTTPKAAPAPKLTPTFLNVDSAGTADATAGGIVIDVSSLLQYTDGNDAKPLYQTGVTYTLTNGQTGQPVTTFAGTASPYTECSILATANFPANTTETYVGVAEDGNPACGLSSVTVPYGTVLLIGASYAGSAMYAPSTSGSPVGLI